MIMNIISGYKFVLVCFACCEYFCCIIFGVAHCFYSFKQVQRFVDFLSSPSQSCLVATIFVEAKYLDVYGHFVQFYKGISKFFKPQVVSFYVSSILI